MGCGRAALETIAPRRGPFPVGAPSRMRGTALLASSCVTARNRADGCFSGHDVVSVRIANGPVTKLGEDPFSLTLSFLSDVQLWPVP